MGGRRLAVAEPPRRTRSGAPAPWLSVQDDDGLWSFDVHGDASTDTVLVLLPALGVPTRYYAPLVTGLLDEGVAVVQADFLADRVRPLGPGRPEGFAALVERCVPAALGAAHNRFPHAAPVILGHSLGGQLGLIAAARYAPGMPVVLAASGSAWHRAFGGWRRWVYLAGSQTIATLARTIGYWPGDRLGFGGRQPTAVMRDWAGVVRSGRYSAATGTFDYDAALADYRGDVLAVTVAQDVLAPWTATAALLTKAPHARVTRRDHAASRGTAGPGAHFTWIKDEPSLASAIMAWARALDSGGRPSR